MDRELIVLLHYRACALTLFGRKPSSPIFVSFCSYDTYFLSQLFEYQLWQLFFFHTVTVAVISAYDWLMI